MTDAMRIVYQSDDWRPELVTGHYVRYLGYGRFRVFEAASGSGRFDGKPGHGPTLREYDCDGTELPADLRDRAIKSHQTEHWK